MEEYVNELEIVLQKIQSLKIEGTYGNILIMKECIERILNLGKAMKEPGQQPMQHVSQMMPQNIPPAPIQIGPEVVEVEEIGNADV